MDKVAFDNVGRLNHSIDSKWQTQEVVPFQITDEQRKILDSILNTFPVKPDSGLLAEDD